MSFANHHRIEILDRPIRALKELGSASVLAMIACAFALAIAAAALGIAGRFGWI